MSAFLLKMLKKMKFDGLVKVITRKGGIDSTVLTIDHTDVTIDKNY